jgi:ClpP class serine protease
LLAKEGIKPRFISAGRYKTEGNFLEPLGDAAQHQFQTEVDAVYTSFINDIVAGRARGLTAARVQQGFGEGRVLNAADALRQGMVDRVFPTTTAAYSYAVSGSRQTQAARADEDHMDFWFVENGSPEDRRAALARAFAAVKRIPWRSARRMATTRSWASASRSGCRRDGQRRAKRAG